MVHFIAMNKRPKAVLLVETDPDNHLASSTSKQAFWSAFTTFNLTVMGNSVLPMPYAFSRTGAIVGLLTMLLVALCNDFTTLLMISAVYETGHDSYESLAQWAGGRPWKVFTQVMLLALLWAPNSGGLMMIGDVAQVMCDKLLGDTAGGWRWLANGNTLMVLVTIFVVLPLSCQKHMRSLQHAATAGMLVVAGLCALLVYKAADAGMPAVASGEFKLWSFKLTNELPEAFSLLGFAFYLQPLMMPIIREMPEGRAGRNALTAAVHTSLLGSSLVFYALTGFFGAALFGAGTQGNVMLNDLAGNSKLGCVVLYGAMLLYLAAGAAACQYPLRTSLDHMLVGEHVPMTKNRSVAVNSFTLFVSLMLALLTPGGAEKVYAVVGASGVCIVCYVLPVCIHIKLLYMHRQQQQKQPCLKLLDQDPVDTSCGSVAIITADYQVEALEAPLLSKQHSSASSLMDLALAAPVLTPSLAVPLLVPFSGNGIGSVGSRMLASLPMWLQWSIQLLVPLSVMMIGIGFSVAALMVAVGRI